MGLQSSDVLYHLQFELDLCDIRTEDRYFHFFNFYAASWL